MPTLPSDNEFIDAATTESTFKTKFAQMLSYFRSLLGSDGTTATAQATLGIPNATSRLANIETVVGTDGLAATARQNLGLASLTLDYVDRGAWATATAYNVDDEITNGGIAYLCVLAHTSGVFATDEAAGNWVIQQGLNNITGLQTIAGAAALRTITPSAARRIWMSYHTTAGDGGCGVFRGVTGAVTGTYTDDNGTVIVPTGGDGSAAWVREVTNFVTPEMFGGSSGMQAAINYAATNNLDLRLAATAYWCSRLYLRYHSVNNPGYPHGKASSIRIIGAGRLSANDEILGNLRGSVINVTSTSGTAVEFGIPTGGSTVELSQSVLSDFTIRASTPGYVLDLSDFHQCTMHRMFIRQLSPLGGGVLAPTIWESDFLDVYIMGAHTGFTRKPSAYSAATGFYVQNIQGDMIGLNHIVCRGFNIGMRIDEALQGGNVTGCRLNSIACNYGIIIGAGATLIKLDNCHGELNTYSNVRAVSGCRKCSIDGGMFLACTDIHRTSANVNVDDTVYNGANFYTCVQAGVTGAASPPTGIGVGIVDGGVIWDYDSTRTDTVFTSIDLQSNAECDVHRPKVIVKDGAAGITTTTTATISQNIDHVWFQQGYSPMPAGVGIANSASVASASNSALNNRFDSAITTQIAKPPGFREYTDSNGLTVVRQRHLALAASGNVNFSTDTIVAASGSTKTITGITSVLPAGTTVQLHLLGLGITLTHSTTSFKLQNQKSVTTSATHYGAMFEFFTPDGTNWIEVSRTNLYLDPVVGFVTSTGTGPINFGNLKIMHELAGGVTITGITSTHPRGAEVTLYCIGVSITLQHTANVFELAGSVNAVTPATHSGALFKFYTPDGTNWYEISRRFP